MNGSLNVFELAVAEATKSQTLSPNLDIDVDPHQLLFISWSSLNPWIDYSHSSQG